MVAPGSRRAANLTDSGVEVDPGGGGRQNPRQAIQGFPFAASGIEHGGRLQRFHDSDRVVEAADQPLHHRVPGLELRSWWCRRFRCCSLPWRVIPWAEAR